MYDDDVTRTFSGSVADGWESKSQYIDSIEGNDDCVPALFSQLVHDNCEHVLDIGCGTGKFDKWVSDNYPNIEITGIDESPEMIKHAVQKQWSTQHHFYVANINTFVCPEHFNIVVMKQVLHHIRDKETALMSANKLLDQNGRMLIMTPNPHHQQNIIPYSRTNDPLGRISVLEMESLTKQTNFVIESAIHNDSRVKFSSELNYFQHLQSIGSLQKIYNYNSEENNLNLFFHIFAPLLSRPSDVQTIFGYSYYILRKKD